MRRGRWPWVIALGLVALMAGIIFWPRHDDDYAFLRGLHPKESFGELPIQVVGSPPTMYHDFEFRQSLNEVKQTLPETWIPAVSASTVPYPSRHYAHFQLPNGKTADLTHYDNQPTTLKVWDDKPTWIQVQIEAIRGFFHL